MRTETTAELKGLYKAAIVFMDKLEHAASMLGDDMSRCDDKTNADFLAWVVLQDALQHIRAGGSHERWLITQLLAVSTHGGLKET